MVEGMQCVNGKDKSRSKVRLSDLNPSARVSVAHCSVVRTLPLPPSAAVCRSLPQSAGSPWVKLSRERETLSLVYVRVGCEGGEMKRGEIRDPSVSSAPDTMPCHAQLPTSWFMGWLFAPLVVSHSQAYDERELCFPPFPPSWPLHITRIMPLITCALACLACLVPQHAYHAHHAYTGTGVDRSTANSLTHMLSLSLLASTDRSNPVQPHQPHQPLSTPFHPSLLALLFSAKVVLCRHIQSFTFALACRCQTRRPFYTAAIYDLVCPPIVDRCVLHPKDGRRVLSWGPRGLRGLRARRVPSPQTDISLTILPSANSGTTKTIHPPMRNSPTEKALPG
ncbi:hypothetical protein SODALDRAFT_376772 [Sodiomyces alkalinus F11]|uniref:Uncharacterized protein n=1 Tax=Sodiomyces alkalinus (strain CBS 110278 / VKM F-3762 / F11) TaxID=1314773 RepID=A0A3N2Q2U3_SODAK|nr:hypothetical protein SODALDRAFT_376772 [Sodiomyces alkalinus F11]ROT41047.1 hypothetical protein SODALDRAFT_376772 [Sodiomyces alkalinus F11]